MISPVPTHLSKRQKGVELQELGESQSKERAEVPPSAPQSHLGSSRPFCHKGFLGEALPRQIADRPLPLGRAGGCAAEQVGVPVI